MAVGTCRCRPEAERHSAAAETGAVAIGAVATGAVATGAVAIGAAVIGAAVIGAAVTNSSLPVDLVFRSSTGIPLTGTIRTATTAIKGTATATKDIATATNGRSKKGKYVREADAIKQGDRPAPKESLSSATYTRTTLT